MNYQIKTIGAALWIVPNAASDPLTNDIKVSIPYINGVGLLSGKPNTGIDGDIKLEWNMGTQPIVATITVSNHIIIDADRSKLKDAWKQFVTALDEQADEAFEYMIHDGPAVVLSQLLQNMPLPQQEVKYYQLHLGFDDKPYIDLQAGMRLKLAFANYYNEAHAGAGQQLKGYAGTGVAYAYVQSGHNGNHLSFNSYMDLQRVSVTAAGNLLEKDLKLIANVIDLAAANKHKYYRLLYPTGEFVASDKAGLDLQNSVCLVGASAYKYLPNLSEQLSPNAPYYHVSLFNGRCVVTPEILIKLNGQPVYVPVGSVLKNLLEKESVTGISPDKLTMLRYYNGKKSKLTFEGTTVATELYLLPGDDITWIPTTNFALNERVKAIFWIRRANVAAAELTELTLISFGRGADVVYPLANDMAVALVALPMVTYASEQVAEALYRNYNYFLSQPYTGDELAYSLYYAGFDVIDVSKGIVAEVVPHIDFDNGDRLVYFLLQSGIGYNVRDVSTGIYKSLYKHEREDAWYMVKALMAGSMTYKQPYHPQKIAEGIYYAVEYVVENAFELAAALIIGSHAVNPDSYYNVGDIARLLYLTYQNDSKLLTELQLAHALVNACKGQPLGYNVSQVAGGLAAVYLDITAERIALTLKDCGGGYGIADVAIGTYSVKYNQSADKISALVLTAALYKAYNGKPDAPAHLNIEIAKAVAIAMLDIETAVLAQALADVFGYKADNEQQVIDLVEALDAVYNFDTKSKDVLVGLAAGLKRAITFNTKEQKHGQHFSKALMSLKSGPVEILNNAWALREALTYNGDDQQDVTFLIGSLFYAYQADVYTLASTIVLTCWYINSRRDQMLHLATGLRDALGYSKDSIEQAELVAQVLIRVLPGISGIDVMWTIGEVFDCNAATPDQAHINFLARITKVVYNIPADNEDRVKELAGNLTEIFKLVKDGEQGKASMGLIANALVFAFNYRGDNEGQVGIVATAIFAPFSALGIDAIGSALFAAFGYHTSYQNQTELNYLAKACAKAFSYNGKDINQVANIVRVVVNVFGLIKDGGQYDKPAVEATAKAIKYAFDYRGDGDGQAAYFTIVTLIKTFPLVEDITVFNAVVPVFEISISKRDEDINNEPNQRRFDLLLIAVRDARDIQITNDDAIILLLQFAAGYFDLNDYGVGALALLAKSMKSVLKLAGLTQDIVNRCTKLLATSYGFLYPEPWLYHDLGQLGKAIKVAFIDEYPCEIVKAFQYALPGLLPSHMGRALVSILNFDQSAGRLEAVASTMFANYNYKAMGYFQILAFGLLLDQCGWGADKLQDKIRWCEKYYPGWDGKDEVYIRCASTDEMFKATSLLIIQDSSPQQMAMEFKAQFPQTHELILGIITGLSIYINYFYLLPQDGTRPIATAFKENGYDKGYCLFVLMGVYENLWNDEYKAIIEQVYNQTTSSQDEAAPVIPIDKSFKEITENVVFGGGK